MIDKKIVCLVAMLIGMSNVHATLFSNCFFDKEEDLYKVGVEEGCGVVMIRFAFSKRGKVERVASCDLVINSNSKTLKIRPCVVECMTKKRFSMIVQWIKEKSKGIEEYKWVTNECE